LNVYFIRAAFIRGLSVQRYQTMTHNGARIVNSQQSNISLKTLA
jgi:hypothetical protein